MTPEEQAIKEIEDLNRDIYQEMLSWLPSWVGKKVLSSHKGHKFAERIMAISQKYVEAKIKSQP